MRLITLKDIMAMEPGEVVPAFKACVKEVREPKSGNNQYGDWTMQSLTLADATAVCPVKLFDCAIYDASWVGAWIVVESTPDTSGKLRGIQVSSYKDKKEIQIKGKAGAVLEEATDLEPAAPAATPATPAPAPRAAAPVGLGSTAAVRQAPVKPVANGGQAALPVKAKEQPTDGVSAAKAKLGQTANAMILAYDAALYISDQVQARHDDITIPLFTPDILEKIAVSLTIELARSGIIMSLPSGPLPRKAPALPPSQMEEPPDDYGQEAE